MIKKVYCNKYITIYDDNGKIIHQTNRNNCNPSHRLGDIEKFFDEDYTMTNYVMSPNPEEEHVIVFEKYSEWLDRMKISK